MFTVAIPTMLILMVSLGNYSDFIFFHTMGTFYKKVNLEIPL